MWLLRTHSVVRSVVSESPTYRRLEGSPECAVTKWRVPILSGQNFPTWGRVKGHINCRLAVNDSTGQSEESLLDELKRFSIRAVTVHKTVKWLYNKYCIITFQHFPGDATDGR